MTAPLIVHDTAELRDDRQEVVLMLNDFSFRAPDDPLAGLTGMSAAAAHAMRRRRTPWHQGQVAMRPASGWRTPTPSNTTRSWPTTKLSSILRLCGWSARDGTVCGSSTAHHRAISGSILVPCSGRWSPLIGFIDKTNTAYRSKKNEAWLAANGMRSCIHRRKPRGRPMPRRTALANAAKSRVGSAVEPVFARQKGPMGLVVRTIGIARATTKIGLANLVYSMQRLVWLSARAAPG